MNADPQPTRGDALAEGSSASHSMIELAEQILCATQATTRLVLALGSLVLTYREGLDSDIVRAALDVRDRRGALLPRGVDLAVQVVLAARAHVSRSRPRARMPVRASWVRGARR